MNSSSGLNQESQKCEQKEPPLHRALEEQEPCDSRGLRHETTRGLDEVILWPKPGITEMRTKGASPPPSR